MGPTCHYFLILQLLPHFPVCIYPHLSHPLPGISHLHPPAALVDFGGGPLCCWHTVLSCRAPLVSGECVALSSKHQPPTTFSLCVVLPHMHRPLDSASGLPRSCCSSMAPAPASPHTGGRGLPFSLRRPHLTPAAGACSPIILSAATRSASPRVGWLSPTPRPPSGDSSSLLPMSACRCQHLVLLPAAARSASAPDGGLADFVMPAAAS